jgi:hypothetical protein
VIPLPLELRPSLRGDPRGCWADNERLGEIDACRETPTDTLGLCAWHRERLFGKKRA